MSKSDKETDFTKDPYWGKGGRYVVNPATGKREPAPAVEETPAGESVSAQIGERPDNAAPGVQIDRQGLAPFADGSKPAAEADPKKPMKERNRA